MSPSTTPRLDTAGIAALIGCTRQHCTARLTKRPDFPKPFINISQKMRYWRHGPRPAANAAHARAVRRS